MTDPIRAALQQTREALAYMHEEKCDYMRRNNLGDPLREDAARLAVPAIAAADAALAAAPQPVALDGLDLGQGWTDIDDWEPGEKVTLDGRYTVEQLENFVRYMRAAPPPAAAEAVQAAPPPGWALVPVEVIEFLRGAAPLEGVWFGERHPTERGAFWWRKRLDAAPTAPGPR